MLARLVTSLVAPLVTPLVSPLRAALPATCTVPARRLCSTTLHAQLLPPPARLGLLPTVQRLLLPPTNSATAGSQHRNITLETLHKRLQNPKPLMKKRPLDGNPFMKGVVLKTLIKKPKKPNSANRRCVLVRLSNGREMVSYVPGEGHNLQEHNIVLCRVGRLRDTPGVKIKCVRGKYDLSHVVKKTAQ